MVSIMILNVIVVAFMNLYIAAKCNQNCGCHVNVETSKSFILQTQFKTIVSIVKYPKKKVQSK